MSKRQINLFGYFAKEKSHIVYKDPKGNYEKFVERFCLRQRCKESSKSKQALVEEAQTAWKLVSKDKIAQADFLRLREGENPFRR